MKQAFSTNEVLGAPAFLSQALVSNDLIFVSGQIHALPDNALVAAK
ncbi:MAG TPA: hypothetical protein VLG11_01425 [Candidatus Saccharimonadales bacterium]|nr:hypothetical protein [Candidatus Saccharimonadales bacterium]